MSREARKCVFGKFPQVILIHCHDLEPLVCTIGMLSENEG